eukprot:GGOE01003338.1.p1 GENE.GGOE01003338.1~~GGOE01003338.1.p1  ORF type:complete len:508 (+),score=50.36 GGOE01003338.1:92-1615(+)
MVLRLDCWQPLVGALCLILAHFVLQKAVTREEQLHTVDRGLHGAADFPRPKPRPRGEPTIEERPRGEVAPFPFVAEYSGLFRRMMIENSIPKRFVLYDPPLQLHIGWGNRFLSLCFLFMYCLLTERVLLMSERSCADVVELFHPPPGVVWSFERVAPMFIGQSNVSGWWFLDSHRMAWKAQAWLCHGGLWRPYHFIVYHGNAYNHYLLAQNPKYQARLHELFGATSSYLRMRRIMRYLFGSPRLHYQDGTWELQQRWNWSRYDHHVAVQFRTFRGDLSYKHMKRYTAPSWACMVQYLQSLHLPVEQTLIFYTTDDKTMVAEGVAKLSPFGVVVGNLNISASAFKLGVLDWAILRNVEHLITTGTTYPMTAHFAAGDNQTLFVAGRHQFGSPASNNTGIWCGTVPRRGWFPPEFDDIAMPMRAEELPAGISCQKAAKSGFPTFMEGGRMVIRRDTSERLSSMFRNRTHVHFLVNWCRRQGATGCTPYDQSLFGPLTNLRWNSSWSGLF